MFFNRRFVASALWVLCCLLTVPRAFAQLSQAIVFPPPPANAYAVTSVALNATSSSGLPVTYSVVSGPASVSGSTLTYLGAGTVVVEADQAGNSSYSAAQPVQNTVTVTTLTEPLQQTSTPVTTLVTFLQPGTLTTLTATSQGAVNGEFTVAPGGTCTAGLQYTAGQTCTVQFVFAPQHPGLRFGAISLTAADTTLLANSYVLGYGTGPQILYDPPNQKNVGNGFSGLSGVAVDGSGNIYAADIVSGGIYQTAASTGATRLIAAVNDPTDVAVDGGGNVFYASRTVVFEALAVNGVLPATPSVRTLSSSYAELDGLKVDANGNVFLADGGGHTPMRGQYGNAIYEILAVNGSIPASPTVRTLESGTGTPTGVAIDVAGDVFYSSQYDNAVYELQAVNGTIPQNAPALTYNNSFSVPTNVTFDVSGNLYVPDAGTNDVKEVLAVNGVLPANPTIISRGVGLLNPEGATVDSSGDIFVADEGSSTTVGQVVELAYGNPPTLVFANTLVGQTSTDSPKSLTITNGGNADLVFSASQGNSDPYITPASFTLDTSTSCPLLQPLTGQDANLPASTSCTYAVDFTPLVQGPITGDLYLNDDNLGVNGAMQIIPLQANGLGIAPTIVFTVPNHTYGDPPFTVQATSNSSGAFTYSVVSGPATISGNVVVLTGAGTVVLQASEAPAGVYAAGTAMASFLVLKANQVITFPQPLSPVAYNSAPVPLNATASSGLPEVYSIVSGPGQIVGDTFVPSAGGTVVIAADQPGNANYNPAPEVQRTILVTYGPAAAVLTATPNPVFLTNPLTLAAAVTGGGGQPTGSVTFQEGNAVLGTVPLSGGAASLVISTLAVGSHVIVAVYNGDSNFAPVASAPVTVVVQDFRLTILNPNVTIPHGGAGVFHLLVSSVGGVGLASTIQLSMAGGPDLSTRTFSQNSIATGSGQTAVTLTIQTPNYPVGPFGRLGGFADPSSGTALALLSFSGIGLGLWRRRRRFSRAVQTMALVLLLGAGAGASLLLGGCGAGWRTQGWNLSVTATSGNLSRTASATLTSACADGQEICPIVQ